MARQEYRKRSLRQNRQQSARWRLSIIPSKRRERKWTPFCRSIWAWHWTRRTKKNLDQFIYLEEYDAYYLLHGDTNFQRCTVTSLEQNEDGTITLTYEQESGEKGIVTLKGSKGSYQFVSNKEA